MKPAENAAAGGSHTKDVAIVGQMPALAKGRRVRVLGDWVHDQKWGPQLKARSFC